MKLAQGIHLAYLVRMSDIQQLPAPSLNITRQTAIGILGSPITLSREVSTSSSRSDIRSADELMRERLRAYKEYLDHELEFLFNEIEALIRRAPSQNPVEDSALLELRDGLKVRYNNLRVKHTRVVSLLEVM